jgi:hypothetical protein
MGKYITVHSINVATDFVPETFGRLTTIGPRFYFYRKCRKRTRTFQVCECICGTVGVYNWDHLKAQHTQSCGCLDRDTKIRLKTTHGKSTVAEYKVYQGIQQRCYNPKNKAYYNYGGRGIRVCARWLEPNGQGFINFLADMGPRLGSGYTIERKDNEMGYSPENCVWADWYTQHSNRRNNVKVEIDGKVDTISNWARYFGFRDHTFRCRLERGWTPQEAAYTPLGNKSTTKQTTKNQEPN